MSNQVKSYTAHTYRYLINKQNGKLNCIFHLAKTGLRNSLFFDPGKYSKTAYGTVGDGKCNGVLNVPAYQYDLGDCCKPLKDAICEFEDDCFCHMFTDFHGRILNFKKVLWFF